MTTSTQVHSPNAQRGKSLPNWTARPRPAPQSIEGRYCRLEALDVAKHGDDLVAAFMATDSASWAYLFIGPFENDAAIRRWLTEAAASQDYVYIAIVDRMTGRAAGLCAYMRIDPANGSIEIGNIHYSDALKRTQAATEAMFLLMRHVFDDLGYRRYEWKCDAFNEPSRRAASRLGFTFEGFFRQHMIVKGHSRDTAWFSIIDSEWPTLKMAYERWLSPTNFGIDGQQRASLANFVAEGE